MESPKLIDLYILGRYGNKDMKESQEIEIKEPYDVLTFFYSITQTHKEKHKEICFDFLISCNGGKTYSKYMGSSPETGYGGECLSDYRFDNTAIGDGIKEAYSFRLPSGMLRILVEVTYLDDGDCGEYVIEEAVIKKSEFFEKVK